MAPPPGLPALRKGPPAGVIFPCANATEAAFLSASVFGMGKAQWPLVAHIRTGTPLFLFNWQSRVMHGVFSATSAGGLDLQPDLLAGIHAPTAKPCPAQVCVQRSRRCRPLQESQLRGVLAASYYDDNRFYWEIERSQVTALIALFVDSSRPNLEEGQLSLEQHPKRARYAAAAPGAQRGQHDQHAGRISMPAYGDELLDEDHGFWGDPRSSRSAERDPVPAPSRHRDSAGHAAHDTWPRSSRYSELSAPPDLLPSYDHPQRSRREVAPFGHGDHHRHTRAREHSVSPVRQHAWSADDQPYQPNGFEPDPAVTTPHPLAHQMQQQAQHAEQAGEPAPLPCQLAGARSAAGFLESDSMRVILDNDFVDDPVKALATSEPDSCGTPISALFDQWRPSYLPDQSHHRMIISVPNDALPAGMPFDAELVPHGLPAAEAPEGDHASMLPGYGHPGAAAGGHPVAVAAYAAGSQHAERSHLQHVDYSGQHHSGRRRSPRHHARHRSRSPGSPDRRLGQHSRRAEFYNDSRQQDEWRGGGFDGREADHRRERHGRADLDSRGGRGRHASEHEDPVNQGQRPSHGRYAAEPRDGQHVRVTFKQPASSAASGQEAQPQRGGQEEQHAQAYSVKATQPLAQLPRHQEPASVRQRSSKLPSAALPLSRKDWDALPQLPKLTTSRPSSAARAVPAAPSSQHPQQASTQPAPAPKLAKLGAPKAVPAYSKSAASKDVKGAGPSLEDVKGGSSGGATAAANPPRRPKQAIQWTSAAAAACAPLSKQPWVTGSPPASVAARKKQQISRTAAKTAAPASLPGSSQPQQASEPAPAPVSTPAPVPTGSALSDSDGMPSQQPRSPAAAASARHPGVSAGPQAAAAASPVTVPASPAAATASPAPAPASPAAASASPAPASQVVDAAAASAHAAPAVAHSDGAANGTLGPLALPALHAEHATAQQLATATDAAARASQQPAKPCAAETSLGSCLPPAGTASHEQLAAAMDVQPAAVHQLSAHAPPDSPANLGPTGDVVPAWPEHEVTNGACANSSGGVRSQQGGAQRSAALPSSPSGTCLDATADTAVAMHPDMANHPQGGPSRSPQHPERQRQGQQELPPGAQEKLPGLPLGAANVANAGSLSNAAPEDAGAAVAVASGDRDSGITSTAATQVSADAGKELVTSEHGHQGGGPEPIDNHAGVTADAAQARHQEGSRGAAQHEDAGGARWRLNRDAAIQDDAPQLSIILQDRSGTPAGEQAPDRQQRAMRDGRACSRGKPPGSGSAALLDQAAGVQLTNQDIVGNRQHNPLGPDEHAADNGTSPKRAPSVLQQAVQPPEDQPLVLSSGKQAVGTANGLGREGVQHVEQHGIDMHAESRQVGAGGLGSDNSVHAPAAVPVVHGNGHPGSTRSEGGDSDNSKREFAKGEEQKGLKRGRKRSGNGLQAGDTYDVSLGSPGRKHVRLSEGAPPELSESESPAFGGEFVALPGSPTLAN